MGETPKRNRMNAFKINEISGVTGPAQEPATVAILKRRDDAPTLDDSKKAKKSKQARKLADLLTGETNGHQHGVEVEVYDERVSIWVGHSMSEGSEGSHSHPVTKNEDGVFVLGMNDGHTHELDQEAILERIPPIAKDDGGDDDTTTGEDDMSKNANADRTITELNLELTELQKRFERSEDINKLTSTEKEFFDGLSPEIQDVFLGKASSLRKKMIDEADAADPVVCTTPDGVEIRKSAGPEVVALAKQAEELARKNREQEDQLRESIYAKRAEEELRFFPGDAMVRAEILKAVDGIEDEDTRKAAHQSLRSQNEAMSKAFVSNGHRGQPIPGTPEDDLEKLTKAYVKENPKATYEQAYFAVIKTGEGRRLYSKIERN